jgi:hypothetical protein
MAPLPHDLTALNGVTIPPPLIPLVIHSYQKPLGAKMRTPPLMENTQMLYTKVFVLGCMESISYRNLFSASVKYKKSNEF